MPPTYDRGSTRTTDELHEYKCVSALLEKLRSSQAWVDLQSSSSASAESSTSKDGIKSAGSSSATSPPLTYGSSTISHDRTNAGASSAVASLLSQLRPDPPAPYSQSSMLNERHFSKFAPPPTLNNFSTTPPPVPSPSRPKKQDLRYATFQQSLSYITRLSENPNFVEALAKMREEQDEMEKQLWEERQAVIKAQEERVKVAVTKAKLLNVGISENEAKNMRQSFISELQKFDKERVVPAWDGLVSKQQASLEKFGVPSMFVSDLQADQERQKRVIQVLESIADSTEE